MGKLELTIDQLLLDSENPRITNAANSRDALQKVLDDQGKKLAELAENIVDEGMSPIDRLLVIREKKGAEHFVTVEGNRRVAALKILANPSVLASLHLSAALQKRFERIAKGFDRTAVEPLDCFEVASRIEANKWIWLRHTGENGGRGVVGWSGVAAARFRGTDPALQALEFVRVHGNLTPDQVENLNDFPITTLDRLLSTTEVRQLIGIEVKEGRLRSGLPGEELIKPLRRMVLDLAEKKITVSTIKDKKAQAEYIRSFDADDKPKLSKGGTVRGVEDFKSGEFKEPARAPGGVRKKGYNPAQRKTVVPSPLKLSITEAKISDIYKELRKLRMEDFPNACAVLLRVFLELSVDTYMDKNGLEQQFTDRGHTRHKSLQMKVTEVIDDLVTKRGFKKSEFAAVARAVGDATSPLHIDLLHAYVHSRFETPTVGNLRAAWTASEPLFIRIWT